MNALTMRSRLPFVLPWKHCLPITGRKTPYKYLGFDVKFSAAGSVESYCHKIFDPRRSIQYFFGVLVGGYHQKVRNLYVGLCVPFFLVYS